MADHMRDTRAQQSAEREDQMRDRFGLVPGGGGRPGVDALLPLGEGVEIPFEVKSSDTDSVSTARDVGREHIDKWRNRHWLFGFYERGSRNPPVAVRYIYASPRQLEPWIGEQEQYVLPDWQLVRLLPGAADRNILIAVAGHKEKYTLQDAKTILKSQKLEAGEHMTAEMRAVLRDAGLPEPRRMTTPVYRALMDRVDGFSPDRMLVLLHERARYLLDRGQPETIRTSPSGGCWLSYRLTRLSSRTLPGRHSAWRCWSGGNFRRWRPPPRLPPSRRSAAARRCQSGPRPCTPRRQRASPPGSPA